MNGLFSEAQTRLTYVFEYLTLADEIWERLTHPKLLLQVSISVHMDDGNLRVFTGYSKIVS